MKPSVQIVVSGGCVEDVQANLPGISVRINDLDQQRAGEPHTSEFEATCVTPFEGQPGTPLTKNELVRFERQMESNFDGARTTVDVLLHLISNNPSSGGGVQRVAKGC